MKTLGIQAAPRAHKGVSATGTAHIKKRPSLVGSLATIALCAVLGSCAGVLNDFDTSGNISKKEYEGLLGRRGPEQKKDQQSADEPPIPGFQSVLAAPSAPELADIRRVSIAVTESTPVRDILIELARKAQVDLELDPRISGGIVMTATDRPFIDVIDRIAELAELRYKMERNTLRVEIDDPYIEQYRMDVLNLTRSASSEASSSTDASSVAQAIGNGGGGAGGSNKSATSISMQSKSAFWKSIGANIGQLLASIQSRRGNQPAPITASFVPEQEKSSGAPSAVSPPNAAGGGSGGAASALNKAAALSTDGRQAQLDSTMKQDQKGPAPGSPELKAGESGGAGGGGTTISSQYSLNAQAGIITVFATQRQQKVVERYLRDVRNSVSQQVLIEAKVLEITLSDQYRAGVDWTSVFGPNNSSKDLTVTSNFTRNVVPPEFTGPTLAANWANGCFPVSPTCPKATGDLSLAVQMVKEFGTVRTLSSPRLTALNNQMAQLKVASNQVFFELKVTVSDATTQQAAKTTVTSEIKTVPVGLIMSVQPSVDPVTKRISLSLRPSITRITGYINDPGVAVTIAVAQQTNASIPNISSPIPIIEVREMESLISMDSGQTVVMGGLMQENVQTTREGLPGVMDVPVLGQAVSENIKQNKVTELVVFIRATLANARDTVADEDIQLYKTFTPDPRPIAF